MLLKTKLKVSNIFVIIFIILLVSVGVFVWWQYHPNRNVYEVDVPILGDPSDCDDDLRIAVIGDYGNTSQREADVAALVHSWDIDYVVTVGDNNYSYGEARTIDKNIGQYYQKYIFPYKGEYGTGAAENRFFPALGNHDWRRGNIDPYLDYFTLPGNERYYDVVLGPVHLFVIDSDPAEPDGRTVDSIQAQWLQSKMLASTSPWKLVAQHHLPYSSGHEHGDDPEMQWPYAEWGTTAVLSGHQHSYERINKDGILYFINGLGGRWRIHTFNEPRPDSMVRYNQDFGAMLITADDNCINFSFYSRGNELIDSVTVTKP